MTEKFQEFLSICGAVILIAAYMVIAGCNPPSTQPLTLAVDNASFASDHRDFSDEHVRSIVVTAQQLKTLTTLVIDYPLDGAVFPPEIVAPTFIFHDQESTSHRWLIHINAGGKNIYTLSDADPLRIPIVIDERCVTDSNVHQPSAYEKSARAWTPDDNSWATMKAKSVTNNLEATIYGLDENNLVFSRGSVRFGTSSDKVGAPIFYRDVPLMPSETMEGLVSPLSQSAVHLIAWRLRDISKDTGPIVMEGMPTCANCHSFSSDGQTLGMDMDGPQGDKGSYAITEIEKTTIIEADEVFSWNDYNPDKVTFGLFSRVSPDGRYVVSSVDEEVFVSNYVDFRFLQTFYPTRAILAIFDRETGRITPLPGADDPNYVHCNAVWSPDGATLAFLRTKAMPARTEGMEMPTFSNDPREPRLRYDIYTMPFNDGRGGMPTALKGASNNGKSNSFPKYSPDGKWLVWVQADNGLLMRPDGRLFIIPAEGGEAREMNCNTSLMNSWHSWSPNSRWLVFSSKSNRPYTEMFLTHIDEFGIDTPAVLIPNSTADNRAVNLPEFANIPGDGIGEILTPAIDYRRLLDRASTLRDDGDLAESEAELRRSLDLKPDYSETRRIFASVLAEQGKAKEAIVQYRRLTNEEPDNASVLNNLGFLLNREGDEEGAIKAYERALVIEPENSIAHLNLGAILARIGRDDEAITHLEKALATDEENISAHRILGLLLYRSGHSGLAISHLEKSVAAQPEQGGIRRKLALAHLRLGQDDQAIIHLEWLIERAPRDPNLHKNLGFALDRSGQCEQAIKHFETAISLKPDLESAWVNWGVALAHIERFDEADAKFRKALEINPNNTSARNNLEKLTRERKSTGN